MPDSPRSVFHLPYRHIYPFSNFEVLQLKAAIVRWFADRSDRNEYALRTTIGRLFELRIHSPAARAIFRRCTNTVRQQNPWDLHPFHRNFEDKLRDMMEFYRNYFNDFSDDEDDYEVRLWNMHDDPL